MAGETEITQANLSARTSGQTEKEMSARDEMESATGRAPKPRIKPLQQARRTQPRYGINHWLATKYPASHRETHCRVTKMHEPHGHPRVLSAITSGEDQHHYRQNSSGQHSAQGTTVPSAWHGSNSTEHYLRLLRPGQ